MVSDYISDLSTRVRNGYNSKLSFIDVKNSRISREILHILQKLGFIGNFTIINSKYIRVFLTYYKNEPGIRFIRRVSKPSNRVYISFKSLHRNVTTATKTNKFFILSTSQGVFTDVEALLLGIGGELLLEIS